MPGVVAESVRLGRQADEVDAREELLQKLENAHMPVLKKDTELDDYQFGAHREDAQRAALKDLRRFERAHPGLSYGQLLALHDARRVPA